MEREAQPPCLTTGWAVKRQHCGSCRSLTVIGPRRLGCDADNSRVGPMERPSQLHARALRGGASCAALFTAPASVVRAADSGEEVADKDGKEACREGGEPRDCLVLTECDR